MNNITKKLMIYSMVGMMQVGVGTTLLEASPVQGEQIQQQFVQLDRGQEDQRHNEEMKRHPGENDQEWHKRQNQEQQRHNENIRQLPR